MQALLSVIAYVYSSNFAKSSAKKNYYGSIQKKIPITHPGLDHALHDYVPSSITPQWSKPCRTHARITVCLNDPF